jgi:hypothetical protein
VVLNLYNIKRGGGLNRSSRKERCAKLRPKLGGRWGEAIKNALPTAPYPFFLFDAEPEQDRGCLLTSINKQLNNLLFRFGISCRASLGLKELTFPIFFFYGAAT